MKTFTFVVLTLMFVSTEPCSINSPQEYTYQLTINSNTGAEQNFHVEISSTPVAASEPDTTILLNQTTPFSRNLSSGKHVITVEYDGEQGSVISKVTGILGGETQGSASSDNQSTTLTAGPGGRYSAAK